MFSLVPRCHGACGVAEVDVEVGIDSELSMLGHLGALVPGQRLPELLGQSRDRQHYSVTYGLGAVAGESGPVVDPFLLAVAWHRWQVQQHREPAGPLHKRPDCGTVESEDQVTFPVSWHGSIVGFGRSLGDHDLGSDEPVAPLPGSCPRDPQRSPGSQTRHELASERTSALHIKRLVDRLVRDSHGLIMGEIDPEAVRDLLRGSTTSPTGALGFSSPQPQAGADYTATLTDPDDVLSTDWTWQRSTRRNGPWAVVTGAIDGVTTSVYRPVAGDVGHYLRATAAYMDGHGPNKSRVLVSANAVRAAPVANVPPSFDDRTPTRSIPENARARAAVGTPVTATDSGAVVTYELSGSDLFTIDSTSGQIRVVAGDSLDHETAPSHSVTVKGSDTSNESDTVTVTIEVTNVNEHPDAVADTGRASEDGDVTIDVLANDSDPEDDRNALTLRVITNPRRGRATVNEPANVGENPTITYTPNGNYHGADFFTYEVRDAGSPSLSDTATVSVEVDAVKGPPTFTSPTTTRSVSESANFGDRAGAPVTATDVDENDTLTYSLSGTEASFFDIGPRIGQITVGEGVSFDIETKDTYTVTVNADDANGGRATVEVTITVRANPTTSTSTPTPTPTPQRRFPTPQRRWGCAPSRQPVRTSRPPSVKVRGLSAQWRRTAPQV